MLEWVGDRRPASLQACVGACFPTHGTLREHRLRGLTTLGKLRPETITKGFPKHVGILASQSALADSAETKWEIYLRL